MPDKNEEIQQLLDSLQSWGGAQVLISKDENGDNDQTVMTLQEISLANHGESIDDYVAPMSVQLQGDGRAIMPDTQVPLPSASYDIPVNDLYDAHFDGTRLYVTTDRGHYTISRI